MEDWKKTALSFALLTLVGLALLAGAYFAASLGPGQPTRLTALELRTEFTPEQQAWHALIVEGEESLRALRLYRLLDTEDLAIHQRVLAAYEALLASDPPGYWNLREAAESVRTEKAEIQARHYHALSMELEAEARRLEESGNWEMARYTYRRAENLQFRINSEFPGTQFANPMRSILLSQSIRNLEAKPLSQKSHLLEQEAEFAANIGDYLAAQHKMMQALELHEQLLRDFLDAPQASPQRLARLESRIVTLQTRSLYRDIRNRISAGDAAAAEGDFTYALQNLSEAHRLQSELNRRYPDSAYASNTHARELLLRVEQLQSRADIEALESSWSEIQRLLADRHVHKAIQRLEPARAHSRRLLESYPLSRDQIEPLDLPLTYLYLMRHSIDRIQDWVYAQLRPLPGNPGAFMSAVETPQWLFAAVSGSNPSATRGDNLPVQRLTLREAEEFCRRLTWIMGKPVTLPRQKHYQQALSLEFTTILRPPDPSAGFEAEATRLITNPQPNRAGFSGLHNDVAEWLDHPEGRVWLGRLGENDDLTLAADPQRRHPEIGFRFVVQRRAPPPTASHATLD